MKTIITVILMVFLVIAIVDVQQDEFSWSQVYIRQDAPTGSATALKVLGPIAFSKAETYNLGLAKIQVLESRTDNQELVLIKLPWLRWGHV